MIHDIDAIYDHGVFRPVEPLALPEGLRVHLRVDETRTRDGASNGAADTDYEAWLNGLAGRWQDDFVLGKEGDFESREPLS